MSSVTVLTNPDGFFDRASDDPSLLPPAGIVLVVALATAAASFPITQVIAESLPAEAGPAGSIAMVSGLLGPFLGTFLFWVIYAVVFHGIAVFAFGGEGSLSRLLAYVGWGHVPAILSVAVSGATNYVIAQNLTPPSDPQQMQAFTRSLQNQPEFVIASLVGLVVLAWQAFIWTFAVRHSHGLDLRGAAITVAIPVVLQAGWQLFNLL
jgi:hypothetical protein